MARDKSAALNGVAALYKARLAADLGQAPADEEFRQLYPSIFSYLTCPNITENQVIDGTSLRLTANVGDWCVGLSCPALGAYAEEVGGTVKEALEKLERKVTTDLHAWRFSRKKQPKIRELKPPKKLT